MWIIVLTKSRGLSLYLTIVLQNCRRFARMRFYVVVYIWSENWSWLIREANWHIHWVGERGRSRGSRGVPNLWNWIYCSTRVASRLKKTSAGWIGKERQRTHGPLDRAVRRGAHSQHNRWCGFNNSCFTPDTDSANNDISCYLCSADVYVVGVSVIARQSCASLHVHSRRLWHFSIASQLRRWVLSLIIESQYFVVMVTSSKVL